MRRMQHHYGAASHETYSSSRAVGTNTLFVSFVVFTPARLRPFSLRRNKLPMLPRRLVSAAMSWTAQESGPRRSLADGTWFKMICGASSQDLPRIRNLAFLYALLGVDCVDAAADPAVVTAVRDGFTAAKQLAAAIGPSPKTRSRFECDSELSQAMLQVSTKGPSTSPWLMVSVNDDEDPHFRKATFPVLECPPACPRPCESICPASAIDETGVLQDICYGCGRCVPICPQNIVSTISYVHTPASIIRLISEVDAIEIHTQSGHGHDFARLWDEIGETVRSQIKLLAVSFPHPGNEDELRAMLQSMWSTLSDLPADMEMVWQTDGRPMSGDIGRGMARASVRLAGLVGTILKKYGIPGRVQPAGGTNDATAPLLEEAGLLQTSEGVAGVAVGGYARKIVAPTLDELAHRGLFKLEDDRELLCRALRVAGPLVQSVKLRRHARKP